jgi:hypothetical protein
MRKHRITDADAASLVSGHSTQGRPELDDLARALSDFRAASFETAPRPSAALAARMDVGKPSMISESNESAFDAGQIETTSSTSRGNRPRKGLVRTVFSWIAGLGLGLKIVLGVALTAAAATGAGAAGVLPFGTQQAFDEVVSVVIPAAEPIDEVTDGDEGVQDGTDDGTEVGTDDGTEVGTDDGTDDGTDQSGDGSDATEGYDPADGNFGSWVSDQAKNKPGSGEDFGHMVSDEAHNKPHPGAKDESQVEEGDDDGSDDDAVSHGKGSQSDHTPAPGKGAH